MERTTTTLLEGGSFFEGPRWHEGRWWVSDFYRHLVLAVTPSGETEHILTVDAQPSGLGWMPDGSLLVVSMGDRKVLRRAPDGTVSEHADLGPHGVGKTNDMVVDARGRAYVGSFGFDLMGGGDPEPSVIVRVDPDGSVRVVADDLQFPNGMVISPDAGSLIVSETLGARLTRFRIDAEGGLDGREVFAQLAPQPTLTSFAEALGSLQVAPDGCCLDAEGHVWVADAIGGGCLRVAPGGGVVDEVRPPEGLATFACMLGGDDGRTLLTCCAPDFAEEARQASREAVLHTTAVDVPHAGLP